MYCYCTAVHCYCTVFALLLLYWLLYCYCTAAVLLLHSLYGCVELTESRESYVSMVVEGYSKVAPCAHWVERETGFSPGVI